MSRTSPRGAQRTGEEPSVLLSCRNQHAFPTRVLRPHFQSWWHSGVLKGLRQRESQGGCWAGAKEQPGARAGPRVCPAHGPHRLLPWVLLAPPILQFYSEDTEVRGRAWSKNKIPRRRSPCPTHQTLRPVKSARVP